MAPRHGFPVLVQLLRRGLVLRSEDLSQRRAEPCLAQQPRDQCAKERLLQQHLDPAGAVEAGVDAAVEQGEIGDAGRQPALLVARQQLKGHGQAHVVGQQAGLGDAEVTPQRLDDVGLLEGAPVVASRLVGVAEAEEVEGQDRVPVVQLARHRLPVP